jgi:transcriptional regulator with XRE-family HTH domain
MFMHARPWRASQEKRKFAMPPVPKPKRTRRPNFLRQWRKHRGLTLATVGAEIGMDGTNLGRIEKGEVPYSQDLLEILAELYSCEVSDLLIRDPTDATGIWSIWERAKPAEREQIVRIAEALVPPQNPDGGPTKPHDAQSPTQSQRKQAKSRTAKAS